MEVRAYLNFRPHLVQAVRNIGSMGGLSATICN